MKSLKKKAIYSSILKYQISKNKKICIVLYTESSKILPEDLNKQKYTALMNSKSLC